MIQVKWGAAPKKTLHLDGEDQAEGKGGVKPENQTAERNFPPGSLTKPVTGAPFAFAYGQTHTGPSRMHPRVRQFHGRL